MHDLRCEECAGQFGRKKLPCPHCPQETVQVGDGDMGATIRRPDRWEGVDVLFPVHDGPGCVANRIASFGDVVVDAVHPEETGGCHPRWGEYVGADVIAVRHPADRFDQEAQEDVAAVAIAAPLSWGGGGRLVCGLGGGGGGLGGGGGGA